MRSSQAATPRVQKLRVEYWGKSQGDRAKTGMGLDRQGNTGFCKNAHVHKREQEYMK
ncbi:hypothetical protein AB0758_44590 [Tolypothrix bouteillei VB521301_2]|uniref:hypothetical protein n=1 Tax=Tolypothrix bouteillei TaxID=1246981 RepID=UPI0038B4FDDE